MDDESIIVDNMVGSGTTLVEAILTKRKSIGFDINPFSVLLSKVKTTQITIEVLNNHFLELKKNFRKFNLEKYDEFIPNMRNIDHWFDKKVQKELAEINYDGYVTAEMIPYVPGRPEKTATAMKKIFK